MKINERENSERRGSTQFALDGNEESYVDEEKIDFQKNLCEKFIIKNWRVSSLSMGMSVDRAKNGYPTIDP